jgi:hypothetical protein
MLKPRILVTGEPERPSAPSSLNGYERAIACAPWCTGKMRAARTVDRATETNDEDR